jgi:hypothetical protein
MWNSIAQLAVTTLFVSGLTVAAIAQDSRTDLPLKQAGRYQIFMHPQFRADQYLLDTVTGQVWQLTKFTSVKGEPEAWTPMTRLDSEMDVMAWIRSKGFKDPETIPPPPAAKPKPQAAPMKLN